MFGGHKVDKAEETRKDAVGIGEPGRASGMFNLRTIVELSVLAELVMHGMTGSNLTAPTVGVEVLGSEG